MLQYKTILPDTLNLLKDLQSLDLFKECRLVGDTALALQFGHRRSVDLDFFGTIRESGEQIKDALKENHNVKLVQESKNIHIFEIDGVKVDVVNYTYEWIDSLVQEDGVRLAGEKDIAAMKISAIIGRGTKKDFIDLYFLLQKYSLKEILDLFAAKYPDGSWFLALKSLSYFEDAEQDPMPMMFEPCKWQDVKRTVKEAIASLQ
ncbi:MAG: nucleotidyl transferase AbiEii/AbiGii toxin family protein [Bacteroidales bacterium]|nr:nucleotidyl transferase AbiEii/AbiGii toxin family protein [Bacteroidales bacterium]